MAVLIVTKDSGGLSRPTEMTVVPPAQELPTAALRQALRGTAINEVFLADTLSAFAMHERVAARFNRVAAEQSSCDELRTLHQALVREHIDHLSTVEALMQAVGISPMYVSPAARLVAFRDESRLQTPRLAGSADRATMELAMIEAALALSETCRANAQVLAAIAKHAQPSGLKSALEAASERLDADDATTLELIRAARLSLFVARAFEHGK